MESKTPEIIVYKVRAIDLKGRIRIVHAYETMEQAKEAIKTMQNTVDTRYDIVPVVNQPDQFWGINFK